MATVQEIVEFHEWIGANSILVPGRHRREEDGGPSWPLLYMALAKDEIPQELWKCLCTVRMLSPRAPLARLLLEDLISLGEDSETHRLFTLLLERLNRDLNDEDQERLGKLSPRLMKGVSKLLKMLDRDNFLEDDEYESISKNAMAIQLLEKDLAEAFPERKNIIGLSMKADLSFLTLPTWAQSPPAATFTAMDKILRRFEEDLPVDNYGVNSVKELFASCAQDESKKIIANSLQENLKEGAMYLKVLWANQEFLTPERAAAFLDLAEEYNLEWAMASFDWGNGIEPRVADTVRRFIDESPWS